ncbi:Phenylpropionate dioxygenase, large terminal subunit [Sphingomonas sp. YR710]|uniref:aromatic ring-hydroxylating oxygenase subunit alpha n=1 Tax=Sphingomonas sp. YR710 TaxID=1882773 RepID=UPI0008900BF8|nr:aromatic ring-hydroxylating dioxygenase subunit alpha [Sphingomonas sp. YR710]SDC83892.1 Phenylpropionate dioxygenase, large terminal subunit [Sphingomonas sp. YR710]
MNIERKLLKEGTAPTVSYQELLKTDARPSPAFFAPVDCDLGTAPIPATNYTSPDFFAREVEKVWMKTWQFACLSDDIPDVGDTHVYELLDQTVLIVRQRDGTIKAFKNVCRHRGRTLVNASGCKSAFRCAYHGLTWGLDGQLTENPFAWDFPQIAADEIPLLTVRCETWAGFIFLNFDQDAAPLLEVIAPMPEHFAHWKIENCYKSVHVAKVAHANWKVCAEAFLEAHHVICTHPEYNLFSGYDSCQTDVLSDHVTRFLAPTGITPGPFLDRGIDDNRRVQLMLAAGNRAFDHSQQIALPAGISARAFAAESVRQLVGARTGYDLSENSDADVLDGIAYDIFPNFHLWGGFKDKISYRFRPISHDRTLMEVFLFSLAPKDGPKPKPAKLNMLGEDQKWTDAPELGALAPVYDQDYSNMEPLQQGLEALGDEVLHFSKYLEMRCRNLHRMVDQYLQR